MSAPDSSTSYSQTMNNGVHAQSESESSPTEFKRQTTNEYLNAGFDLDDRVREDIKWGNDEVAAQKKRCKEYGKQHPVSRCLRGTPSAVRNGVISAQDYDSRCDLEHWLRPAKQGLHYVAHWRSGRSHHQQPAVMNANDNTGTRRTNESRANEDSASNDASTSASRNEPSHYRQSSAVHPATVDGNTFGGYSRSTAPPDSSRETGAAATPASSVQ